jgi:phosphopantothenoylcysteine decarboxylase/phosphopantothenate--cysteine ligase
MNAQHDLIPPLAGKHIVVGVSGSIAAYKAADFIRRLREQQAEVRVVMTKGAAEFITPLTLQTLSGHPVAIELLDADQESAMGHIALARWADWVTIVPASADTIARLVQGRADDLLTALCLATEATLAIAPAMNNKMWSNPSTQENLVSLRSRGAYIMGPASGDQACGEQGEGRLMEPVDIVQQLSDWTVPRKLAGKEVVITAGPTYEPIDPVRFIGNRSSGKMGYALAEAAQQAGAKVTLISGPTALPTPTSVQRIDVETAEQMLSVAQTMTSGANIFIACAAVSDYQPHQTYKNKLKKSNGAGLTLDLVHTPDILATIANSKYRPEFVVGFAAETDNLSEYAQSKLVNKQLDMIAANEVGEGKAMGTNDNALEVYWSDQHHSIEMAPKSQVAKALINLIIEQYYAKNSA